MSLPARDSVHARPDRAAGRTRLGRGMGRLLQIILLALLVFGTAAATAPPIPRVEDGPLHVPGAAVASGHAIATEAGIEMLRRGGNAYDAAVAVSAMLSVVEPISSGLGGGGFYLLHDGDSGQDLMLDARETAPAAATPAAFLDKTGQLDRDRSVNGPWSAGIPGLPAALVWLSEHRGRLPLSVTLAPAIRVAREGFPLYPRMIKGFDERRAVLERYPGTRALFWQHGRPPQVGDRFRQPDLARTLERIAKHGFDGFYRGPVARRMVREVNAEGGQWTLDELAGYRVRERTPIRFRYRGWDIVTAPPPSSGGVALAEILNILSGWDLSTLSPAERTHLEVEAMRRAFRDRTIYLGDPDFVSMPLGRLLSRDYAAGLRAGISPDKATPSTLLPGQPAPLEDNETTHFAIIDRDGNMVSATQTVNLLYGSGMVVPGTGVLLNDEMDDFALRPGTPNAFGVMGFAANAPAAGKRMLSSMSPSFMFSPNKVIALGAPGGSRIITEVLFGILGYDAGLDAQQVAALPRVHHQWWPDVISAEKGALDADTVSRLQAMGHTVNAAEAPWGNLQTVAWNRRSGTLEGGTDPRNPVGKAEVINLSQMAPLAPRGSVRAGSP